MKYGFAREPAVWIGLIVSVLSIVEGIVTGTVSYEDGLPAIVGIIVRRFVVPVATQKVQEA